MSSLLRIYLRALDKHPWKTQALSTGTLMATGDVIAQLVVERKKEQAYDFYRTSRFFIFGTVFMGPALRSWYSLLDRITARTAAKVAPLQKMLLDQSLFAPCIALIFLSTMTYWRTHSREEVDRKLRQDYKTVLLANYKLWPAAQIVNFYFVPFQHRILFVNVVALFWNTYLAYKTEQHVVTPPAALVSQEPAIAHKSGQTS